MAISRRVLAARRNGRLGGLATASNSTPEFREQRASNAGSAVREKYGVDYFGHIARSSRRRTSSRKAVQEVTKEIAPTVSVSTLNNAGNISTLQLMQAAAKSCLGN